MAKSKHRPDVHIHRPHHMPLAWCPVCISKCDAATPVSTNGQRATPEAGDVTVCLSCWSLLRFTPGMQLERVPDDQIESYTAGNRLLRVILELKEAWNQQANSEAAQP